ncbi:spermidine/putrescine ABC transporter substrate-binding protein [Plantibacter sp. Mn2098]|uniref:spermidine/putrescine ABC transporter substrate-binding protein n=1 Tax=Plantibacter sp. Mn2098 TaxID=3395266 RepID=UPI003BCF0CA7
MERSLETTVAQAVDAWLRWLPRWHPSTHRGRTRVCRRCLGSPVLAAAGIASDVPHAVQHGLATRMKTIVDHAVADYTERNLPLLGAELRDADARAALTPYRPGEGLDPEFDGLQLDPDPDPEQPYLFTLAELGSDRPAAAAPPPLSEEAKQALRTEIGLADACANETGRRVCEILIEHRVRIHDGIARYVEPQITALLDDLALELDSPRSPW